MDIESYRVILAKRGPSITFSQRVPGSSPGRLTQRRQGLWHLRHLRKLSWCQLLVPKILGAVRKRKIRDEADRLLRARSEVGMKKRKMKAPHARLKLGRKLTLDENLRVDIKATQALREEMARRRGPSRMFDFGGSIEELKARCKEETGFDPPVSPTFATWVRSRQQKLSRLHEAKR
jgi:hypothetical protein